MSITLQNHVMAINLNFLKTALFIIVSLFLLYFAAFCFYTIVYHAAQHHSIQYFGTPSVDTVGSIFNEDGTWTLKDGTIWDGR